MTASIITEAIVDGKFDKDLEADVLVIGGSIAGAWAALNAREAGASVIVVEKGWLGTAGIVAAATSAGYYLLPDNPDQRKFTIGMRHSEAGELDDFGFIESVLDESYSAFKKMEAMGFRFSKFGKLRGPDTMVFLRRQLLQHGVKILDHSPALELLRDSDGAVAGATGLMRKENKTWRVRAGAVVIATGGNAFRSGALGTNGCTGEGLLMAAEAGAQFLGMEFSGHYMVTPENSSCTKGGQYMFARIVDDAGNRLDTDIVFDQPLHVERAISQGRKVFASISKVGADVREDLRISMPNFYLYFDRLGIDPFVDKWPVEVRYEGTVRAVGGIKIGDDCGAGVPGLYAAGDATERIRMTGAALSGAGSAIGWCMASGKRAGLAAAKFATALGSAKGDRSTSGLGAAGIRPFGASQIDSAKLLSTVQGEMFPLDKNAFREENQLIRSLAVLDEAWAAATAGISSGDARQALKAREAAAMVATGRWIYNSARERRETRGLHRRTDFPNIDPALKCNFSVGGLDSVWVRRTELP
jgi:succinate dehydrogenase/fumarate reductase flavoprotein subunit